MHIIVTGGAGFIGSHLCERLTAKGHQVVAIDNFDPFYDPKLKWENLRDLQKDPHFRLVEADIRDPRGMLEAVTVEIGSGADVIIHLAARAGVRPSLEEPFEYGRTNVDGTVAVLEMARALGVNRFVFGSSSSVYGNNSKVPFSESDPVDFPISPYAATKRSGELICHTFHHLYGMSIACLRFFTVYGPRQRPDLAIHKFARLMAAGEPIPLFGDGSMKRDYTYIDDILQGIEGAIKYTEAVPPIFEIFNLGESRTTTTARLIELIQVELGLRPAVTRLPSQPGDVEQTFADVSKARRLLGYDPQIPLEVGLPLFLEWFRSTRSDPE